jgi:hypothetical protein
MCAGSEHAVLVGEARPQRGMILHRAIAGNAEQVPRAVVLEMRSEVLSSARALCLLLCGLLLGHVPGSIARAEPVSVGFRAAILIRALGYERRTATEQGDFMLVVVGSTQGPGLVDGRTMFETFSGLAQRLRIGTRTLTVVSVIHRDVNATRAQLARLKPQGVYFASGLERVAASSADVLGPGTVTMCADGAELAEGCVLGVQATDEGSVLVVHLGRGRRAGLSFDPRMLRLARVLE